MRGENTLNREDHVAEEKSIPEKWVGEKIRLVSVGGSQTRSANCTLEEVNDRGVVISHKGATRFHPWNTIISLQLGEPTRRRPRARASSF
jgi:hypothetical protein